MTRFYAGDVFEGEVVDLGMNGEGIVKCGAYPIFVPFAITGEKVKIKIKLAKKDFAFGELIEVLSPSIDRVKPLCPYFTRCGGCDMQHMIAQLQLETKRKSLQNTLRKVGGIDKVVGAVESLNEWKYRNKLSLPFGFVDQTQKVVLGFYEKQSHKVVPMKWCPLHDEWAANLIAAVLAWANENSVTVFDENTSLGLLRHLVARKLDNLSITLVINGESVPNLDGLIDNLNKSFSDFTIFVSPNLSNTNIIMGDTVKLVYGEIKKQNIGKFSAEISPLSFLQVNSVVRDAIYSEVCKSLEDFNGDIIELYSGIGLLSAELALGLKDCKITAVEIVEEAKKNADNLIHSLGLDNRVTNVCQDAVEFMQSLEKDTQKSRVLILDPPRKGCEQSVISAAISAGFCRIIYISCNPTSLARDLKLFVNSSNIKTFTDTCTSIDQSTSVVDASNDKSSSVVDRSNDKSSSVVDASNDQVSTITNTSNDEETQSSIGYFLQSIKPYDMFPQTSHVETVACLYRK